MQSNFNIFTRDSR